MNNIKLPLISGLVIFLIVLVINISSGNSFPVVILRSFISLIVSFGLFFGASYVLTEVLKIDFSASDNGENVEDSENKVDITVDDMDMSEVSDSGEAEAEGDDDDELKPQDIHMDSDTDELQEESVIEDAGSPFSSSDVHEYDNDAAVEDSDYEEQNAESVSGKNGNLEESYKSEQFNEKDLSSVQDKFGINASPEDLAKAIRTKMAKDG